VVWGRRNLKLLWVVTGHNLVSLMSQCHGFSVFSMLTQFLQKFLAFLNGELSNSVTYFSSFANVCTSDIKCLQGKFTKELESCN
jgi:hypothetical protein